MTLDQQIHDWKAIHSVANACPGKPTDQALAEVRKYMEQKHFNATHGQTGTLEYFSWN